MAARSATRRALSRYLLPAVLAVALHALVLWQSAGLPQARSELRAPATMVAVLLKPPPAAAPPSAAEAPVDSPASRPVAPPQQQRAAPRQAPAPAQARAVAPAQASAIEAPAPTEALLIAPAAPEQALAAAAQVAASPAPAPESPDPTAPTGQRLDLRLMVAMTEGSRTQVATGRLSFVQQAGRQQSSLQWGQPTGTDPAAPFVLNSERALGDDPPWVAGEPAADAGPALAGGAAMDWIAAVWHWRRMLQAAPADAWRPGQQWSMAMQDESGAAQWLWQMEPPDMLRLAQRNIRSLRLSASPPEPASIARVDLWFAPDMDFAPVRLRLLKRDGRILDFMWQETLS